jgi:hypothetical protein
MPNATKKLVYSKCVIVTSWILLEYTLQACKHSQTYQSTQLFIDFASLTRQLIIPADPTVRECVTISLFILGVVALLSLRKHQ